MQNYNIAQIGRIVGLAIIVIGTIVAIWNAIDLGDFADADDQVRAFVQATLNYLAFGGLVYLGAEILDRVTAKHE